MSTTTHAPARRARQVAAALAAVGLTLSLAACGDDDEGSAATPAPPATEEAAPQPSATPDTGEADAGASAAPAPTGDDEQRFGVSLEQTGEVIVDTFEDAEDFRIDGETLTVIFGGDTSAGFDGMIDCLSVAGLMSEGETLILEYPDGPTTC